MKLQVALLYYRVKLDIFALVIMGGLHGEISCKWW